MKAALLISVLFFVAIVSVPLSPGQAPTSRPIPPKVVSEKERYPPPKEGLVPDKETAIKIAEAGLMGAQEKEKTGASATPTDGRVVGPYASRLSAADIEQIKVAANPAGERLGEINAIGIDKVNVQAGTEATYTRVTLIKHGGKWMVVDKVVTVY